jgi:hypothetical protein
MSGKETPIGQMGSPPCLTIGLIIRETVFMSPYEDDLLTFLLRSAFYSYRSNHDTMFFLFCRKVAFSFFFVQIVFYATLYRQNTLSDLLLLCEKCIFCLNLPTCKLGYELSANKLPAQNPT